MKAHELLPSRKQIVLLVIVFGIFCVVVPIQVAGELVHRGERSDLLNGALLVASAIASGLMAWRICRWFDRLQNALLRAE